MSAGDRTVRTRTFAHSVEKMQEAIAAQAVDPDDVPWTYEVEAHSISFFESGVFVERWVEA